MTATKLRRRTVVPRVEASIDARSEGLAECVERESAAWLTSGGDIVGVVFSTTAYEAFSTGVERLELELRAWQSEVERRDGTLVPHEQVVADTERLLAAYREAMEDGPVSHERVMSHFAKRRAKQP